jgi:hypothetical protein
MMLSEVIYNMGRKDLTTRKPVSISIRKDLIEKLQALSEETMIPQTKLVDRGIELLLEKRERGEDLHAKG